MRYRLTGVTMLLAGLMYVCACVPNHKDAIVFGTNTTFAVDVSMNATTQAPNLTVGYKRQEGVFMPLLTNGEKSRFVNCSTVAIGMRNQCEKVKIESLGSDGVKYIGHEDNKNKQIDNKDAYSVFGSFGADILAKSGKVGINQFFATGIAARKLAENPRVYNLFAPEANGKASDDAPQTARDIAAALEISKFLKEDGKDTVSDDKLKTIAKNTFMESMKTDDYAKFKSQLLETAVLGTNSLDFELMRKRLEAVKLIDNLKE